MIRFPAATIAAVLLSGCATVSGSGNFSPGEEVRAEVIGIWKPALFDKEIAAAETAEKREALRRAIGPALQAGRAIQYRCAEGGGAVVANAVLSPGMEIKRGETVRVRVGDAAREIPNRVIGKVSTPRLRRASFPPPYAGTVMTTPWSGYVKEGPVEPWVEAEYARIVTTQPVYLIRCRAPG